MWVKVLSWGLVLTVLVVWERTTHKHPQTVTIDDWWNVDYAKAECETLKADGKFCLNPVGQLYQFEGEIKTQFGIDPQCHGIELYDFKGPDDKHPKWTPTDDSNWQLTVDFVPGDEGTQSWSVIRTGDWKAGMGTGTPKEIAHSVCSMLSGVGGTVH